MNLWQLLKILCLPLVYQSSLMDDVEDRGLSTAPLDPIEVACSFDYEEGLPEYPFVNVAVASISDPTFFKQHVLKQSARATGTKRTHTRHAYKGHLVMLEKYGVVTRIAAHLVLCLCRYFAVAKTETISRSIFDGRNVSDMCNTPPTMRLPDTGNISKYFAAHPGDVRLIALDLRHYFHQIRLHKEIQPYFVVCVGGQHYVWKALPMGWSWSPAIAQSLTIAVAAEAARNISLDGASVSVDLNSSSEVPGHFDISVKGRKARVYVTYDNVLFVGEGRLTGLWADAVQELCKERRLHIKDGSFHDTTSKDMAREGTKFEHLGMELSVTSGGRRCVNVASASLEKWSRTLCTAKTTRTNRVAARMIGMILHGTRMRFGSLLSARKTLGIARTLGKQAQNNWNNACCLSVQDYGYLMMALNTLVTANPVKLEIPSGKRRDVLVVAADASDHKGGAVLVPKDGYMQLLGNSFTFPKEYTHIFLKEVMAARICIDRAAKLHPRSHIVLLEDNTAAAGAIARGWSSSWRATEEIDKLYAHLKMHDCVLTVRSVPSASNPADEPSRDRPLCQHKALPFMPLYNDVDQALLLKKNEDRAYCAGLRHLEIDDDEDMANFEELMHELTGEESADVNTWDERECADAEEHDELSHASS